MLRLEPGAVVFGLRVERELGRGAFGVVYLAEDELIGRQVAVKVISATVAPSGARESALREARAVGRLKNARIVTLHRVHPMEGEQGWLLEMEFVEGGSLTALLDRDRKLPVDEALPMLTGILEGLQAAHAANIVHGDVKPGNVLLDAQGEVKLADFGLSWMMDDQSLSQSAEEGPVGTPMYMAPEVIMGEPRLPASDLWSVGIVAYRMLAGRMPFRTNNLHDLFFSVQNATPSPLPVSVPEFLQALVARLLSKSPGERPTAADALSEIRRATKSAPTPARRAPARVLPPAPKLFGRAGELEELDELLVGLDDNRGAALLVTGDAGSGKTALVAALVARAAKRGLRWIESTASAMQGVLRPLLRAVARVVESEPGLEERLAADMLAPDLVRELLDGRIDMNLGSRPQIVWAVEQLLRGIAKETPLLLVVENAHETDAEDHKLLSELATRVARSPVLVVVTYRTHDVDASAPESRSLAGFHDLASVEGIRHMGLGPLPANEIYGLLEHLSDAIHIEGDIAQRVIQLSEGNPLFAVEMMRHFEDVGAVVMDGSSMRSGETWEASSLPSRFHELVAARLSGLGADERGLIDAAAVDGREFDGEALEAVLDRPLLGILRDLQRLYRDHNLVESHGDGYRFTNSVVQEVVYEEIAPALRRAIHQRIAGHLEERATDVDPERVGLHWERAGQLDSAIPHLMRAAAGAAERQERRRLVDLCGRAGVTPDYVAKELAQNHLDTLLSLGHAYTDLSRPADADKLFALLEETGDEEERLRVRVNRLQTVIYTTGVSDTTTFQRAAESLPLCWERGDAKYELGVIAKWRGALTEAEGWLRAAQEDYQALGLVARQGNTRIQLASLALRADRFGDAEELYAEAAAMCRAAGREINASAADVNRAIAAFESGRLEGLEPVVERAVRTLTLEGSMTLAPGGSVVLAQLRYALGDLDGSVRAVEAALDMLDAEQDAAALEDARLEEAHLAAIRGRLDEALRSVALARQLAEEQQHLLGQVCAACVETQILCFAGDREGASTSARRAQELALASEEMMTRRAPVDWLAEAIVYGLPVQAVRCGRGSELMQAALAYASGDEKIVAPVTRPGPRRFAIAVLQDGLAGEALWRTGQADEARQRTADALKRSEGLGHVWLQAWLLRQLCRMGEARNEALDALIWRLAENLEQKGERRRLVQAWAPPHS